MISKEISVVLSDAIELIIPQRCIICGAGTAGSSYKSLTRCYDSVVRIREDYNQRSSRLSLCRKCLLDLVRIEDIDRWNFCLSNPVPNDPYPELPLYIGFSYEGIMRRIVTNLKFRGKFECGFLLGLLLGKCLKEDGVEVDMIVPVPLHGKRLKERGYNQAELIAYTVGKMLGKPVINDVLSRKVYTSKQSELRDVNDRISNIKDAFEVNKDWDLSSSTVLLVDDVATTGFTMHEVASSLLDSGCKKVLCCAASGNRLIKNADRF